jgi:hypothetical protein
MTEDEINKALGIEPINYEQEKKNNMAYWFPLLQQIRMRIPETILIHTGYCDLGMMVDGKKPKGFDLFLNRLKEAIADIGLPCFLRSGMTSNKHDWKHSCYVENVEKLTNHIFSIVEYSFIANISGLPLDYSIWAVRKIIPTRALFFDFDEMPIVKERRLFINKGKLVCNHPYWPSDCFHRKHPKKEITDLQSISENESAELKLMAEHVGKYFTGYWSVDFLQDADGNWWLTDMAVGERSYHWPNCNAILATGKEILNECNEASG